MRLLAFVLSLRSGLPPEVRHRRKQLRVASDLNRIEAAVANRNYLDNIESEQRVARTLTAISTRYALPDVLGLAEEALQATEGTRR